MNWGSESLNLLEVNLIFPAKEPLHVHGPLFRGKVDLHSTLLSPHNQAANYSKYSKKEKNLQRQGWVPNVYVRGLGGAPMLHYHQFPATCWED